MPPRTLIWLQVRLTSFKYFIALKNASDYFEEVYRRNNRSLPSSCYAFDSVWSAALMLNDSKGDTRPENYIIGNDSFSTAYVSALKEQEFEGMSVSFSFL